MGKGQSPDEFSRRRFLGQAAMVSAGLAATQALRLLAADASSSRRPNILFLLTDDQRWDTMGCAGNPIIRTPNMDAMARAGARFPNAFVTTSICMASRATIFTGLYERTHHVSLGTPPLDDKFVDMTYPARLKAAGYRTGFVGKFGFGISKTGRERMFDWFQSLGQPYWRKQPGGSLKHATDLTADAAIGFLRGCRPDQPFCLSISFAAPHATDRSKEQYFWPKEYDDLYKDVTIPMPETADPAFFERQPEFLKKTMNRDRWHWRFDDPKKAQEMIEGHYRMITHVDAAIGRLRQELERLGVGGNTIVFLMGDNGYFLGDRGYADKWLPYEVSLRVPLVIDDPRAPRAQRGIVPEQMALNEDIAPTILEYAGLEPSGKMQGRSLVPLLHKDESAEANWRHDFLCEFLRDHPRIPKSEGVRNERWKYIRYFGQKPVYEELYDLKADPHEKNNLVKDAGARETLAALRRRCDELREKYGGEWTYPKRRGRRARTENDKE